MLSSKKSWAWKLHRPLKKITIGNNVTIYSGACILGGETVIGDNVTIGCNAFVSKSIEDNKLIIDINETLEKNKKKY